MTIALFLTAFVMLQGMFWFGYYVGKRHDR